MADSPLLVIAGPTGVGKTAAAVALGARLPIEVVSADSRQVYRGMDVATGKPTAEERAIVPHHLIDVLEPDDTYDAARFAREARAAIDAIRARGRLPVVVGGTGFYIRALVRGLDPAAPADPAFRAELAGIAAREGRQVLHARLADAAPTVAGRLHPNDHVRVIRRWSSCVPAAPPAQRRRAGASRPPIRTWSMSPSLSTARASTSACAAVPRRWSTPASRTRCAGCSRAATRRRCPRCRASAIASSRASSPAISRATRRSD